MKAFKIFIPSIVIFALFTGCSSLKIATTLDGVFTYDEAWSLTDERIGGEVNIYKLESGKYRSNKSNKTYDRVNSLLIWEFPQVNDRNVQEIAAKMREIK